MKRYHYFVHYGYASPKVHGEGNFSIPTVEPVTNLDQVQEMENLISDHYRDQGFDEVKVIVRNYQLLREEDVPA